MNTNNTYCKLIGERVINLATDINTMLITAIEILESAQTNSAIQKARTKLSTVGQKNYDIRAQTKNVVESCLDNDMKEAIIKKTSNLNSSVLEIQEFISKNNVIFDEYKDLKFILKLKVARDDAFDLAELWNSYLNPEASGASAAMNNRTLPTLKKSGGRRKRTRHARSQRKRTHRRRTHRK